MDLGMKRKFPKIERSEVEFRIIISLITIEYFHLNGSLKIFKLKIINFLLEIFNKFSLDLLQYDTNLTPPKIYYKKIPT